MSNTLLALAKSFHNDRLTAEEFVNAYMELWKYERDNDLLTKDDMSLSECLSSIFCLVDLYDPEDDRDDYELDQVQLGDKISELIHKLNL